MGFSLCFFIFYMVRYADFAETTFHYSTERQRWRWRQRKIYVWKRSSIFVSFIWIFGWIFIFLLSPFSLNWVRCAVVATFYRPCPYVCKYVVDIHIILMSNSIYSLQRNCLTILNKNGAKQQQHHRQQQQQYQKMRSIVGSVCHSIPILFNFIMILLFRRTSKFIRTKISLDDVRQENSTE